VNGACSYPRGDRWRTAICILGAHRSGTSPITRVLNLLGLYLGAEGDLIPARPDNPKGFWEHSGLVRVNDRLLTIIAGAEQLDDRVWMGPPRWPDGWDRLPAVRMLARRTETMLRMHFGRERQWGFKDPRTALTLPFWQVLLPGMRYVICLRDPHDSARSLAKRDGIMLEQAYALWSRHMKAACNATAAPRRIVVSFEALLADTDREVGRLAAFIGMPERSEDPAIRAAIADHLDEALWHMRGDADGSTVPEAVGDLYRWLLTESETPARS
jgi:hypothetical protein